MLVVEHYAEAPIGIDLVDQPFHGQQLFLGHASPFTCVSETVPCARKRATGPGGAIRKGVAGWKRRQIPPRATLAKVLWGLSAREATRDGFGAGADWRSLFSRAHGNQPRP